MSEMKVLNEFLMTGLVSGVVATIVMSVFITAVSKSSWVPMSMPIIIGTIFSNDNNDAKFIGWIFHIVTGTIFAFLYVYFLNFFEVINNPTSVLAGAAMGLLHGFTIFFIFIPSLAEHHPLKSVRNVGGGLALVYFFAHIIYGAAVGGLAYTMYSII